MEDHATVALWPSCWPGRELLRPMESKTRSWKKCEGEGDQCTAQGLERMGIGVGVVKCFLVCRGLVLNVAMWLDGPEGYPSVCKTVRVCTSMPPTAGKTCNIGNPSGGSTLPSWLSSTAPAYYMQLKIILCHFVIITKAHEETFVFETFCSQGGHYCSSSHLAETLVEG